MYDQRNNLAFRQFLLQLKKQPAVRVCKKHLQNIREKIHRIYGEAGNDHPRIAAQLVEGFAFDIDTLVITLWRYEGLHLCSNVSLIATGGYGRMQLHPYSDVDVLVIHRFKRLDLQTSEKLAAFMRNLWDCGIQAGSSIRSLSQAKLDITTDLTLLTSLLESRHLIGQRNLHVQLMDSAYKRVTGNIAYLRHKLIEQSARHNRFDHVSYLLEPNIKNSPGALRDVHCIFWHSQVVLRGSSLAKLLQEGLISHAGAHQFIRARNLLISVRLGLHLLAGKAEERLLIDYQRQLAVWLGYRATKKPVVEVFMQRVYKALLAVSAINDSTSTMLNERLHPPKRKRAINTDFYAEGDTLMCYDTSCFIHNPSNLLLCFRLIAQNPSLRRLGGDCMKAVYENSLLIDKAFRHNPLHRRYFIDILAARRDVSQILEQMKRFGVLGRYLEVFGAIIGQLQHDLVHVFTVDAHTLQVMHWMYTLLQPTSHQDENLRIPSQVASHLPEFPVLLMAGLFHDIAKGRGGNHAELGVVDVTEFARDHQLPAWQVTMLAWLVKHHLRMSETAQGQDVDDPIVVEKFASLVGDKMHLDYLYVLTVADINATNPTLWNAWRAALLTKLYQHTLSYLHEREHYVNSLVDNRRQAALEQLAGTQIAKANVLWDSLPDEFFHSKSIDNIVLHSTMMIRWLTRVNGRKISDPMLLLRPTHNLISLGATELSVLHHNRAGLFFQIISAVTQKGCNVLQARAFRIIDQDSVYSLVSLIVLDTANKPIAKRRYSALRQQLNDDLAKQSTLPLPPPLLLARQRKQWFIPNIQIHKVTDGTTRLRVECIDFHGLLACIAGVLATCNIAVVRASVTTLGDRAIDSFIIEKEGKNQTITSTLATTIQDSLHQQFDRIAATHIAG